MNLKHIYLIHNGVDRGKFFKNLSGVLDYIIDYAALDEKHPLFTDECQALEVDDFEYDPDELELFTGDVYLEYDNDGGVAAIKYIEDIPEGEEEDKDWLWLDDFRDDLTIHFITESGK